MKWTTTREWMLAPGFFAVYMALLPHRWAREVFPLSFGFVIAWMIDPRLKGRLWLLMILSPAFAFMANVLYQAFR